MRGRLETTLSGAAEGPVIVGLSSGTADVLLDLPHSETRRCYYLGFVLGSESPLTLEAAVDQVAGGSSEPVRLDVPASGCVAGLVEVEPMPVHGARLRVTFESETEDVQLYDLFVISTG
jgi:hypothetical protein